MEFLDRLAEAAKNDWIRDMVRRQLAAARGSASGGARSRGGRGGGGSGSSSLSSTGSGGISWESSGGGSTPRLVEAVSTEVSLAFFLSLIVSGVLAGCSCRCPSGPPLAPRP